MRRILFTVVLLAITFLFVIASRPTAAQTPAAPKCDLTSVIKAANAFKASGDNKTDLSALLKLRDQISAADIACNGLTFKGTRVAKLVGPFDLPEGNYKVTATTPGYLIVRVRVLSGECDEGSLFVLSDGEATSGSETLYVSKGCKIVLEPSNISANWTLTFEPMEQ